MSAKSQSWFYPKPTGDVGRDRNARTLQFSCLLFASALAAVGVLDTISGEQVPLPIFGSSLGLVAATAMNRAGRSAWAGRTAIVAMMLGATLLVLEAHDGFRSHAMLVFPGLLLISVMLLDRTSYVTTAGIVLLAVAALGIAEKHGLTRATPGMRTPTSYDSIFYVDLTLAVFAMIGSRIARDAQENVFDLRASIDRLSAANLELVQIKEHLQESEQRLKSAQGLTQVGSWHWNLGVNQVACSEEWKRIFGQPENYAPTLEGLLQIITTGDRRRVASEIERGIAQKSGCSTEFQIVRPNGDLRTVTFTSQVLLDEEGSPQHIFGACQDVTEVRRAQEQTIARQKLESLGTLANGIAHDFNNLLAGVLAQAELAHSELADGVNPEGELRAIRDVAIRGSEIVRELMIYAGKESASEGLVDVSRIVREMLELLKVSVSKHAVLETDLGEGLPAVRANAAQLRQIVMNLVTNASDAIKDREGVIRVATRSMKAGQRSSGDISGRLPAGDYLELEVSDTGCGIPLEAQARILDPFFTTKSAGHGLGLAIVDGIVRGIGGAIDLTSEPGKGTTFQIWLPCAENTVAATTGAMSGIAEVPGVTRAAATVLVVEDEAPLRQAVTQLLRRTGFQVFEAADGTSALALVRGNRDKIDVILLDVTIPGSSSAEVLAEAAKAQPATKVILTSAYSRETLAPPMNAFEVSGFIRKPFQLGDLVQTLRNALSL